MADIVNGLLLRDGKVLIAHRSPQRRNYPNTWSFPGGHVEEGETLEQALRRELTEEIGIQAEVCSFLEQFIDAKTNPEKPVTFHFFAVETWRGEPINIGQEHTQISWIKLDEAIRMQGLTFEFYVDLFKRLKRD